MFYHFLVWEAATGGKCYKLEFSFAGVDRTQATRCWRFQSLNLCGLSPSDLCGHRLPAGYCSAGDSQEFLKNKHHNFQFEHFEWKKFLLRFPRCEGCIHLWYFQFHFFFLTESLVRGSNGTVLFHFFLYFHLNILPGIKEGNDLIGRGLKCFSRAEISAGAQGWRRQSKVGMRQIPGRSLKLLDFLQFSFS